MLPRTFIENSINNYVTIETYDKKYYEGILKKFENNIVILDTEIGIKYYEITRMASEIVN